MLSCYPNHSPMDYPCCSIHKIPNLIRPNNNNNVKRYQQLGESNWGHCDSNWPGIHLIVINSPKTHKKSLNFNFMSCWNNHKNHIVLSIYSNSYNLPVYIEIHSNISITNNWYNTRPYYTWITFIQYIKTPLELNTKFKRIPIHFHCRNST